MAKIQQAGTQNTPGAGFHYNSGHMAVAGLMAEKASGKSWSALFADTVVTPLALATETAYYALPKQKLGKANPLLAGGMVISMGDYGAFLTALQGLGSVKLLPATLFAEQHTNISFSSTSTTAADILMSGPTAGGKPWDRDIYQTLRAVAKSSS